MLVFCLSNLRTRTDRSVEGLGYGDRRHTGTVRTIWAGVQMEEIGKGLSLTLLRSFGLRGINLPRVLGHHDGSYKHKVVAPALSTKSSRMSLPAPSNIGSCTGGAHRQDFFCFFKCMRPCEQNQTQLPTSKGEGVSGIHTGGIEGILSTE